MKNQERKGYIPTDKEPYWQRFWEEEGLYQFDPSSELPVYTIDTPPPTISGKLHLGHIFSYTQTEIIARALRFQGYNLRYPFGFDGNGLPTERLTEKETGQLGRNLELQKFINLCEGIVKKYSPQYERLVRRLGFSMDFGLEYSTSSPEIQKFSQSTFIDLYEKDHIYQKTAPALYCPECRTSIAQAEAEDKKQASVFYDVAFRKSDGSELVIATTRPELLPACVAVFVHPEDSRYKNLVGQEVITPLGERVKVFSDERVSMEKGTAAVMCCSYGDNTDVEWIRDHRLPEKVIIGEDGKFTSLSSFTQLVGLSVEEGRKVIVSWLLENGFIKGEKEIEHDVGVHERCGTAIEIVPITQWFIRILPIRDQLLSMADKINWYPKHMKKRYRDWVTNLSWDWCISRGRFFGIPVPVFHCQDCREVILPSVDELPIDPRTDQKRRNCPSCNSKNIVGDNNVLDTWFTSSQTPDINNMMPQNGPLRGHLYPMNMRAQAHDIIRTWTAHTIEMEFIKNGEMPWRDIVISGHILAKKGEKISKRTGGGAYDPNELIDQYSADPIRYAMSGASLGQDTFFDEKEVESGKRLITKIYNAGIFVILNLQGYTPPEEVDPNSFQAADRWILTRLNETTSKMIASFSQYEYGRARQTFEDFFWKDFCGIYLEVVKGRIYGPEGAAKDSAMFALYHAYLGVLKLISPYMPHITEEMYHMEVTGDDFKSMMADGKQDKGYYFERVGAKSIHQTRWETNVLEDRDNSSLEGGELMCEIIEKVRKFKSARRMKLGSPLGRIVIRYSDEDKANLLGDFVNDIASVSRAEEVVLISVRDKKSHQADLELEL